MIASVSAPTAVFCNAGPLIAFGKLNRLDVLAGVYPQAQIPEAVYHEVVTRGALRNEPDALIIRLFLRRSQWSIIAVADELPAQVQPLIPLGRGELAVLALARVTPGSLALLDDAFARREARRLKLHAQGTLGILVEAYRRRQLTQPQLALLLDEIAARPDIWIRASLCRQVLENLPDLSPIEE